MIDPKNEIKFLSEDEVRHIINKIGGYKTMRRLRDRALLEVLYSTGLRISECLALPVEPFEVADGSQTMELAICGKGGYQRAVYISPQAQEVVKLYLKKRKSDSELLFPITVRGAQYIIKRRAHDAGFEGIHPHMIRHSFATNLLEKGVDIFYLKEFMGHKALSSTQKYLHVRNGALKEIHNKLYQ